MLLRASGFRMKTSLACPRKVPLALNPPEFTHLSGEWHSLPVPASHLGRRGALEHKDHRDASDWGHI